MLKAVREAKVQSSWINPNTAYEEALAAFVRCLCASQDPIRTSLPARTLTLKQTVEHLVSRLRLYLPISRSRFLGVSPESL